MKISRRISRICQVCNKTFETYKAWLRNGRAGKFCSRKCKDIGCAKKPKIIYFNNCLECKNEFSYRKGRGGTYQFCSVPCMAKYRGRLMSGPNHPFWKGGMAKRTWSSRNAIKNRINEVGYCENCGTTEKLQGHHINSFSEYPEERANENNIKVLCLECHSKEHPKMKDFIIRGWYHGKKLDKKGNLVAGVSA